MDTLEGKFILPDYYRPYIEQKADRVKELIRRSDPEGDVFIFITDEHWKRNRKNSLPLIAYLERHTGISRLFSGGDEEDGPGGEFRAGIREAFHGEIYHAAGNHEYFGHTPESRVAEAFGRDNPKNTGNPNRQYYYVDNPGGKVRYIVLNLFSSAGEVGSETTGVWDLDQLEWLEKTALDVEEGWTILVITHMLFKISKKADRWAINPYALKCMKILDGYKGKGVIAAILQGHTHRDRIAYTDSGIPILVTTCDKNRVPDSGDGFVDIRVPRPSGTLREQAFDVMILDKKARCITAVRIGCPAQLDGERYPERETEERVVKYYGNEPAGYRKPGLPKKMQLIIERNDRKVQ